jgi:pimeloyl-ACP methyl ester carboxylesterase
MRRVVVVVLLLVAAPVVFDFAMPEAAARAWIQLGRSGAGLAAGRADAGGFDIAYLGGGEGEPLVLVHGFGGNKDNWTRIAAELAPHYRVIIPDLPGFGESSKPGSVGYTIAEQVERLRAFVKQLGLPRVHLGGNSMGGSIALAYAAKYPEEVATLWLLAPAATREAFDTELSEHYDRTGEVLLLARSPDDLPRIVAFVTAHPPWIPHSVRKVAGAQAFANRELHAAIFRQLAGDRGTLLDAATGTRIATPALIVWGREDRVLNPKGAEATRALLPASELVMLDGIGHVPHIEASRRVAEDYLAFRHNTQP